MPGRLFTPLRVGRMELSTRVVMAPLTRSRAPGGIPNEMMARYYAQRANPKTGASLIISEGAGISPRSFGYAGVPGIYNEEHAAGWKLVTDAVHEQGGRIFCQLWHVGRVSHTSLQPKEGAPIAPSAIRAEMQRVWVPTGDGAGEFQPASEPRELMFTEMSEIVRTFAAAARLALDDAGFDGVEIHGANGYLLDQFLKSTANQRTDLYGGSIENRCRLPLEVIRAVVKAAGGGARVGLRISPVSPACGIGSDPEAQPLFEHLLREAGASQLAYVHVVEGATGGARELPQAFDYDALCRAWRDGGAQGAWMVNNGYNAEMAEAALAKGPAELVSFGRPFVANPDLGARMERGAPLNEVDHATLYGGGEKGYLDYPALPAEA